MGRLPDDVLEFIGARFASRDRNELARLLAQQPQMAPRVLRAVLFLCDGSVSLLRHYLERVQADVRDVILAAEYVTGVAADPLHVRDMSEPFWSERNLGQTFERSVSACSASPERKAPAQRAKPAKARKRQHKVSYHAALASRRFALGSITYVVMKDQPSARCVRCLRIENNVTNLVRLPLEFVLEQLAEHIELSPLHYAQS